MKKLFIFLVCIVSFGTVYAQKKIANKIYLYGNVTNKLKGTIIILFAGADPKTELSVINKFKAQGARAISYNSLFMPGVKYSDDEFSRITKENEVQGVLYITVTDVATANYSYSNTKANASAYSTLNYGTASGSSSTTGGSVDYTAAVSLKIEIFSSSNQFERPIGVVVGEAVGSGGIASTTRSISKKIMGRVVSGLSKEQAFQ